jgi:aspartyl-tRNA(Asn)/glutamyl-tRNA(Gln) amidotransferase subunit A
MDAAFLTISEMAALLSRGETSSLELTDTLLQRIDALQERTGAFLLVTHDLARQQAKDADRRKQAGESGSLLGIPMALKDVLSTPGIRTTCGSKILETYVPRYEATVVRRLREAGAVLVGKTNMDEFAMGSSNENSGFFPVRNPWDSDRVPGGSSGGSAVAVAAGMVPFALGTDTGGSIRQPAALTGTVGLKPTYGRVSRYGLIAFASSLDQIGPLTRSVRDAAIVLHAIAGRDPLDSTSVARPVPDYDAALREELRGLRIGVPREFLGEGLDPAVEQAVRESLEIFSGLGASLQEVSLPHTEHALSTYYIISPAEAMANLARYDGVRYGLSVPGATIWDEFLATREQGFGDEVKRRILLGTYVLSAGYYDAYYVKAQQVRTLVCQDYERAFEQVDLLVGPTSPTVAFKLGERLADPLQMYLSDVYTVPANMAGICGISLPCGFSEGLPIGLQILGPPFGEEAILKAAHAFERVTPYARQHPDLVVTA